MIPTLPPLRLRTGFTTLGGSFPHCAASQTITLRVLSSEPTLPNGATVAACGFWKSGRSDPR